MPTNGRSRWKFSFGRSSTSPPLSPPPPSKFKSKAKAKAKNCENEFVSATPVSFVCPISSSLMFDPVIIYNGQTFERACIEACIYLNFTPPSLSSSSSSIDISSSSLIQIPNTALKAAIIDWCDRFSLPHPPPLSKQSATVLVQNLIFSVSSSNSQTLDLDLDLKEEKQQQQQQPCPRPFSSPSSSSYPSSSSASSFSSSEINNNNNNDWRDPSSSKSSATEICDDDPTTTTTTTCLDDPPLDLKEPILIKLKNSQISVKDSALITLRQLTRESSQHRISLCTPRLLAALLPMILSNNSSIQINVTAALVNLSIEPVNKVKIVRSGAVPPLVEALKYNNTHTEARDNAAGALFSLALEDENKLAIGVLGAIPPLVSMFCQLYIQSAGFIARVEAGMALYHLSLAPNNLSKIAKTAGAVKAILNIATASAGVDEQEESKMRLRLRRVALMVLASLARRNEGRVALMDAGAVRAMVGLMMKEEEGELAARKEVEDEYHQYYYYCLAVMYEMSKGSLRFRALARAAGAERVLLAMAEEGGKGGVAIWNGMATRTLKVIRGNEERRDALMFDDEEVGSVV